jgi:hypothetical protein
VGRICIWTFRTTGNGFHASLKTKQIQIVSLINASQLEPQKFLKCIFFFPKIITLLLLTVENKRMQKTSISKTVKDSEKKI